jgi:dihydrodipicolinate synthase/N-acetylneuraminate lyase
MPILLAASVTPLTAAGEAVDEDAIGPLVAYLEAGGVDGIFACGTTGEGVLLSERERQRAAERFREACRGTLIVHCGAQTTATTVALAAHAAEIGADGAAVIPPPYFQLDDAALVDYAVAAAAACAPLPFYLYAFSARSGYALPPAVVAAVARRAQNLAGLKVSEPSMEAVSPYLGLGLPVLVGSEPLIPDALAAGAAGSVSGLASAFPAEVAAVVRNPTADGAAHVRRLREALGTTTLIASAKYVLGRRGVPIGPDVRPPLRRLTRVEQDALAAI